MHTSGVSLGPIHSITDWAMNACSNLAAGVNADGVLGFFSFCPNVLSLPVNNYSKFL